MNYKVLNTLELFCGTKSFSTVANKLGHKTFTVDVNSEFKPDLCADIMTLDLNKLPSKIDVLWMSPPCTFFSVASIGKHWNKDDTPKTKNAIYGLKLLEKTIDILNITKPKFWFIENPRGKMRKMNCIKHLKRDTVWYCQYGDSRAKPTDIWNNLNLWFPKTCHNGNNNCHHEAAPRGSKTGTQGLKNAKLRSIIPEKLFFELFHVIDYQLKNKTKPLSKQKKLF